MIDPVVLRSVKWAMVGLACMMASPADGIAAGKLKHPLKKLSRDPQAATVELFEGIEGGQLRVQVIPRNSFGANVLIENTTSKPLNVTLPSAVVAVPKHLAQFGGGVGGGGGLGQGSLGGQGGGGGGQQALGGGFGGQGGGQIGGGGGQGGGGFFGGGGFGSIPPEQVASIALNSVCLEHGRAEPSLKSDYVLIPVNTVTDDGALFQLLETVGEGRVDRQAAQAAAWNLANKMSWQDLVNKQEQHLGGAPPTRYFTQQQLRDAQHLVAAAQLKAQKAPPLVKPNPRSGRAAALPLNVGDTAPEFELKSLDGQSVQLSNAVKAGPVVLVVLRGFPGYQCPVCNQQVGQFLTQAEKFKALGAKMIFVYPGARQNLEQRAREFLRDKTWPDHFQFLTDPDYTFTNAYGLRWDAANESAYPATFVIQKERQIAFAKISTTHGGRAKPEEVLQELAGKP